MRAAAGEPPSGFCIQISKDREVVQNIPLTKLRTLIGRLDLSK